jgi:putative DNA primase/helicase
LEGYAEVSPSGTGVHVIVRGAAPNRQEDSVEAYSSGRYFTVTARAIFGRGLPPPERQEGLNVLGPEVSLRRDRDARNRPLAKGRAR